MKQVHYTGIGCKKSHIHIKKEFLKLAKNNLMNVNQKNAKKTKLVLEEEHYTKKC